MDNLIRDLRLSLRQIRRSPGFAIMTVLTLALAIGATTSIFSLVNAVLLRPLPFPEQSRLVSLLQVEQSAGGPPVPGEISYPDFFDFRTNQHVFTAIASYRGNNATLTGAGDALQLSSAVVSSDFFRVLGIRPILGRDFITADEKAKTHVAMLSHQLWQTTFGGAKDMAGHTITVDGDSYTVVGVMPPGFGFPIQNPPVALWTSSGDDAQFFPQRGAAVLDAIGRLKPGVSVIQAKAAMDVIAQNLAAQYPDSDKNRGTVSATTLLDQLVGDNRPALRILFGAVALVLIIACANVAGLLLARSSRRRSDIALQAALGASPGEIVRQVLAESVVLSILAGGLGFVLSAAAVRWLPRLVPKDLPRLDQISVDGTVLAFALAASILTGLLFGILPAWRMSRFDPLVALREGSRGVTITRGQQRLQSCLVVAEIALGLVLLVGSGLLIRSFIRVQNVNPGVDTENVLTANLSLPFSRYPREQRIDFYHRLFSRIGSFPGVQSVSAGFPVPLSGSRIGISIEVEGRPIAKGDEPSEDLAIVTPEFFRTLKIPLRAGRAFTAGDSTAGKPVMIVNERFARKYFPGENPIRRRIKPGLGDGTIASTMREVVGVVGDVRGVGLTQDAPPQYYLPWEQAVVVAPTLVIRTSQDPTNLIATLRAEIAEMDRQVPLYRVNTLDALAYRAAAQPRFQTLLLTSFAVMALLLSSIGLYSLLSYMVVQRSTEIGVRVALGAQRADVLRLILGRGMMLAATGGIIGIGAATLLTDYLTSMLFSIRPLDGITFAGVTATLLLVSFIAGAVPAYRAANLDPMKTLRV